MLIVVLAAGELGEPMAVRRLLPPRPPDQVICADGGIRHLAALGLQPDLIVGDLDSAPAELTSRYQSAGVPVHRVPRAKDETDSHLVLAAAVARGATELVLLGFTGTRLDHTLNNLLLLTGLPRHIPAAAINDRNVFRVLGPGETLVVTRRPGAVLSLVPLSHEVTGVTATGVRWDLQNACLQWGESRGVSNEVVAAQATVGVGRGWLAVIEAWD